jgi:hypothetical protein
MHCAQVPAMKPRRPPRSTSYQVALPSTSCPCTMASTFATLPSGRLPRGAPFVDGSGRTLRPMPPVFTTRIRGQSARGSGGGGGGAAASGSGGGGSAASGSVTGGGVEPPAPPSKSVSGGSGGVSPPSPVSCPVPPLPPFPPGSPKVSASCSRSSPAPPAPSPPVSPKRNAPSASSAEGPDSSAPSPQALVSAASRNKGRKPECVRGLMRRTVRETRVPCKGGRQPS